MAVPFPSGSQAAALMVAVASQPPHPRKDEVRAPQPEDAGHPRPPLAPHRVPDEQARRVALDAHRPTAAVVDLFVYVVVLNLFVEYLPSVLSETFTLSVLTAVLLKVVLELVVAVKNRVRRRYTQASTRIGRTAAAALLWLVLVGSKFVVLEAVDVVFGSRVSLGGFVPVTALIVTLLLSRAVVRRLLRGPRPRVPSPPAAAR